MKTLKPALWASTAGVIALCTFVLVSRATPAQPVGLTALPLDPWNTMPDLAGELVYRGATWPQTQPGQAPLFTYERRLVRNAATTTANHLTRTPTGDLLIVESAVFNSDYALQQVHIDNRQQAFQASAQVSPDGAAVDYITVKNGELSSAHESLSAPAVAGPSLHGYVLHHWDVLVLGSKLPVRLLVPGEKTSYGFEITLGGQDARTTRFMLTPTSWVIRFMVAPLEVTFDTQTRQIVRYVGRVPPQQTVDGKLKDLDARVEYTTYAPSYR